MSRPRWWRIIGLIVLPVLAWTIVLLAGAAIWDHFARP